MRAGTSAPVRQESAVVPLVVAAVVHTNTPDLTREGEDGDDTLLQEPHACATPLQKGSDNTSAPVKDLNLLYSTSNTVTPVFFL